MKFRILIAILLITTAGSAQEARMDSLKDAFSLDKSPLEQTKIMHNIGQEYYYINRDSSRKYLLAAYKIAKSIQNNEYLSRTSGTLAIMEAVNDPTKSTDYIIESLEAAHKSKDTSVMAYAYNAAGTHYRFLHELELSIEYFQKAIPYYLGLKDDVGLSHVYNNMGISYMMQFKYDQGLEFWQKSLELKLKLGDKIGASTTLANIAIYYKDINKLDEAKKYVEEAVALEKAAGDYERVGNSENTLGDIYVKEKNYYEGIKRYNLALSYFDTCNTDHGRVDSYRGLYEAYEGLGDYKNALEFHKEYLFMTKDLFDETKSRISDEMKTKYETEKKEEENKLLTSQNELKDAKISETEAKRELQSTQNLILTVCLVFAGISILFVVLGYRKVRRDKHLVESKNEIIEEKSKEITDSILYAKRLQDALLPKTLDIKKHLPSHFILFEPKDVVSGDFYWFENKNDVNLIAVADCTGHGVPGAMVSVVCNNGLNRAVREHGLTKTNEILDKTREIVIDEFNKSEEEVKDGMDIALVGLKGNVLSYSGANNPLWLIRNNSNEVEEFKANKEPIGIYAKRTPFDAVEIEVNKGDMFFLFSDGYPDQFGGDKGKKLKYKPLKQKLVEINGLSMDDQKSTLESFFKEWKGDYDQIDDVCIIGVRI